ncbi:hypothetical protein BC829DRAFT_378174 [Chytridium lagenaria]|nr:hypothetical protein BC829DRAFT_378174 [Chytridium lagenaria]
MGLEEVADFLVECVGVARGGGEVPWDRGVMEVRKREDEEGSICGSHASSPTDVPSSPHMMGKSTSPGLSPRLVGQDGLIVVMFLRHRCCVTAGTTIGDVVRRMVEDGRQRVWVVSERRGRADEEERKSEKGAGRKMVTFADGTIGGGGGGESMTGRRRCVSMPAAAVGMDGDVWSWQAAPITSLNAQQTQVDGQWEDEDEDEDRVAVAVISATDIPLVAGTPLLSYSSLFSGY